MTKHAFENDAPPTLVGASVTYGDWIIRRIDARRMVVRSKPGVVFVLHTEPGDTVGSLVERARQRS